MANYRTSGYQYETSPRKLQPEYKPQKNPYVKKKASTLKQQKAEQQPKKQLKSHTKIVVQIFVVFAILFAIGYQNSLINESFNRKTNLQNQLSITKKENEQLRVSIENSLNLNNIEKIAKERLGMQKLDESQKVYVNLPKKDYVEPASEEVIIEQEKSWFENLMDKFLDI